MSTCETMHVLLIEDDPAHAELVSVLLDSANIETSLMHVSEGGAALDYLNRRDPYVDARRPNIIVLDLKLPNMNGHEFLQIVKGDPELCTIPVVVLTTSTNSQDRQRAYELHANSFLTKPLDFDKIQQMIKNLVQYWGTWNQPPPPDGIANARCAH